MGNGWEEEGKAEKAEGERLGLEPTHQKMGEKKGKGERVQSLPIKRR